jgi:aspartyl-tRNA(Asn)/glutamyl-tRNA(Gln) amidotransferase subunit A
MGSSLDSPGPLTKNVVDAALVTEVIAGHDPNDATTAPFDLELQGQSLKVSDLKIALPKEYFLKEMDPRVTKLIRGAAEQFQSMGAKVSEVSLLDPNYSIGVYTIVQRSEVSSNLARYDGVRYGNNRKSFSWQAKNRSLLGTFALSSGYYDQYYAKAQKVRTLIIEDFKKLYSKFDLYLSATSPGPALKVGAGLENPMFGEMEDKLVEASSIAGLTGLSVPCGLVDGLPIGLQITGAQFKEAKVLAAGRAYQKETDWHLEGASL